MTLGTVLSVLMLAMIGMLGLAFIAWRKGASRKQIGLMLLLALIMAINIAIWTVPDASGDAPVEKAETLG
jgi:hypothetical protein